MARAALRLLQNCFDAERSDVTRDVICLMPHNRHNLARLERLAGAYNVFDERASPGAMQHLRQRRFQPRPLAGRQNHNHNIGICHNSIVSGSKPFYNGSRRRTPRMEHLCAMAYSPFLIDLFDNWVNVRKNRFQR
jgi:hypothetical protein